MRAILTYHSIDTSGSPISCHPEAFAHHVEWLASGRVRVTTIEELLELPDHADAVALTFDDGFVNFGDVAAPRLLEYGLPVTVFVVAALAGKTNSWDTGPRRATPDLPLLDWPALTRLQEAGVTIGAHGLTHRSLPGLEPEQIEDELHGAADWIESRGGRRPSLFAYPYGHWDAGSAQAVARAFTWACTTEFQPLGISPRSLALPRLDMYYFQRPGSLDNWGTQGFRARLTLRHGLRRARSVAAFLGSPHR